MEIMIPFFMSPSISGDICVIHSPANGSLIKENIKMNDNDKGHLNDDINFSAPGGDFQSVLDDDMVPFEQV